MVSKQKISKFHSALQGWYRDHGRHGLPWRQTDDPYAIYLSEIMLQQTQVKTVLERFYAPFLGRFPTLEALAAAPQEEVLKAWQGLGYYSRAANAHKAARLCGGKLPRTVEELLALPGIGRNTAHAVCAFAYRAPVAVMEANVKRVISRIFALAQPQEAELWEKAQLLLNQHDPFVYNQAMMDIGAMVCTRRAPDCTRCPASILCAGKGQPERYPAPRQKKHVPVRRKSIIVLQNAKGAYHAEPRLSRFLGGLYRFVEIDRPPEGSKARQELQRQLRRVLLRLDAAAQGARPALTKLGNISQQYSHFTLAAEVYLCKTSCAGGKNWYSRPQLEKLPLSGAEQKILALI